ncbi:hypothetical protein D9758_017825 [Tetrapyrgos nigripes]|uniref:CARD domain-containing protein n=1 Tax=Tetrapyrgos nigripes TaxID=182062 RepID=A0A8H5C542_9AGAR|nr:hypothetical protein D9758_017825 [Tetrapyrgos nigripes]
MKKYKNKEEQRLAANAKSNRYYHRNAQKISIARNTNRNKLALQMAKQETKKRLKRQERLSIRTDSESSKLNSIARVEDIQRSFNIRVNYSPMSYLEQICLKTQEWMVISARDSVCPALSDSFDILIKGANESCKHLEVGDEYTQGARVKRRIEQFVACMEDIAIAGIKGNLKVEYKCSSFKSIRSRWLCHPSFWFLPFMSNSHSASSNSHSASNSEPVYLQQARVVFLEPGEVIVVASRVVHAPPSTLYEVPQDVEPGFTFIATRTPPFDPTIAEPARRYVWTPEEATPPPSPMLSSASSLESEVPESQVPVQLPATRSTQQVSPSDNPPTTDPLTPTSSALSTSHAAYTRADAPPPYVAQIQQPLPEGLVKVYAAWNSHVPTPVEILTYWPRALYEKCYIVLEGCRIGIFPTCQGPSPNRLWRGYQAQDSNPSVSQRPYLHSDSLIDIDVSSQDNPTQGWLPFREEYLEEMLWVEGRRGLGDQCSACSVVNPIYRCVDEECVLAGMMCKKCMISSHATHPLHWIERWSGNRFEPETLKSLGLVIQLGHRPKERCVFYQAAHSDFTVIHTNAIHEVSVRFCGCDDNLSHRTQLLRTLWYPATAADPQTATTFSCLRQFQHLNCQGKLPAYDYYHCLEIMTQSRQRVKPKPRYPAFLRTMFQWRHLKMCKRAGRGHAASGIEGTTQGELGLDCPACPRPDKSLPPDWKEKGELSLFLAIDANFRLRNRVVSSTDKSPILGDGWAYLVNSIPYRKHIEGHVSDTDGLRVSGVGGICCARHRVWRKNGIGDLQKGERYCNIDFIFWSTIDGEDYLVLVISYDISCQWSVNFWERMAKIDKNFKVKFTKTGVRFMVPKFHLRAHKPGCHFKFSFDYAPGCGETHGETIEEGWSQSNKAAGQTKEMGLGTRAMTLDDIFGFANWRTIARLDENIGKRLVVAVKEFDLHEWDFKQFDNSLASTLGREILGEWRDSVLAWENDHSKPCPYEDLEHDEEKGQLKTVQLEMIAEEKAMLEAGTSAFATSPRSLELYILTNKYLTTAQQLEVEKRRSGLLKHITQFRNLQSMLMPRLSDVLSAEEMEHIENPDLSRPEKIRLFLPSECGTASAMRTACVAGLMDNEARLREVEARDALEGVRDGLRARTAANRYKVQNITGQIGNTRASGVLRDIDIRIHSHKIRYQLARDALLSLRGHGKWEETLRPLKDEDVRGLSERALTREEQAQREAIMSRLGVGVDEEWSDGEGLEEVMITSRRGERTRHLSWIWYNLRAEELSEGDPEYREALRVEWCKARARVHRWREELMLLTDELRRMVDYSIWKGEWWMKRVVGQEGMKTSVSAELAEGLNAYAWQQVKYQEERAVQVTDRWYKLRTHADKVLNRIQALPTLFLDFGEDDTDIIKEAEACI